MLKKQLCEQARSAREKSYSPYSDCRVGAALLCADGSIYQGANIENASYSATVCAERVAIDAAVLDGKRDFVAIAVAGGKGDALGEFPPCGVCRQVMAEFCEPDFCILVVTADGAKEYTLGELLPHGFTGDNITR